MKYSTTSFRVTCIFLVSFLFPSCDLIHDFLQMEPLIIESYSPEEGHLDPESFQQFLLTFSAAPNKSSIEQSCSLYLEEQMVPLRFQWEEETLKILPIWKLEKNRTYRLEVSGGEDTRGNSLTEPLYLKYFTGMESTNPRLLHHLPLQGEKVENEREAIILAFSEAISPPTLYSALSISPEVTGEYSWEEGGRVLRFIPHYPYQKGMEYRVSLKTECRDLSGNPLSETLEFSFFTTALDPLEILEVKADPSGVVFHNTEMLYLNKGIEKDDTLICNFSRAVTPEEREDLLLFLPYQIHDVSWAEDLGSCSIFFQDVLVYGEVYELKLGEETFRFLVDGSHSIPLEVGGVTFCNDYTLPSPHFHELSLNDFLNLSNSDNACFDFYIIHSIQTGLSIPSVLDAFRFTVSNSAMGYTFREMEEDPISPPPITLYPGGPGTGKTVSIVRFYLSLSESFNPGILSLSLLSSAQDNRGNSLKETYTLEINL